MLWRPATIEEVQGVVAEDLEKCSPIQLAIFERYRVEPFVAQMSRYGTVEGAVVVALERLL